MGPLHVLDYVQMLRSDLEIQREAAVFLPSSLSAEVLAMYGL